MEHDCFYINANFVSSNSKWTILLFQQRYSRIAMLFNHCSSKNHLTSCEIFNCVHVCIVDRIKQTMLSVVTFNQSTTLFQTSELRSLIELIVGRECLYVHARLYMFLWSYTFGTGCYINGKNEKWCINAGMN